MSENSVTPEDVCPDCYHSMAKLHTVYGHPAGQWHCETCGYSKPIDYGEGANLLIESLRARVAELEAERDAANAAMLIYREFYEVARDADKVSELTDSTNYDHDTLNLWVDAVEAVKKIRALEGKSE